jgi:hypothetical protein
MDELDDTRTLVLWQCKNDRVDEHERACWRDERSVPGQVDTHDEHDRRLCVHKANQEQAGSGALSGRVQCGGPGGNDGRIHVRPLIVQRGSSS